MLPTTEQPPRLLLLTTTRSYRMDDFRAAAERLGVEIVVGLDLPDALAEQWPDALPLPFGDEAEAARRIVAAAARHALALLAATGRRCV